MLDSSIAVAAGSTLAMFVVAFAAGSLPLLPWVRTNHRLLMLMTRLAAGFLIASAFIVAIPEGIEMTIEARGPPAADAGGALAPDLTMGVALLLGFALMLGLESLGLGHDIHEEHHHDDRAHLHHPVPGAHPGPNLPRLVLIGLGTHALADGLAIGVALATGSLLLTASMLLAIAMHKIPAAFSLAAFSMHTHGDVRQSLLEVTVFSLATPVAMLAAWHSLAGVSGTWLGHALLFSAGTFLYVATVDVLPQIIRDRDRRLVALQVLLGAVLLSATIVAVQYFGLLAVGHA